MDAPVFCEREVRCRVLEECVERGARLEANRARRVVLDEREERRAVAQVGRVGEEEVPVSVQQARAGLLPGGIQLERRVEREGGGRTRARERKQVKASCRICAESRLQKRESAPTQQAVERDVHAPSVVPLAAVLLRVGPRPVPPRRRRSRARDRRRRALSPPRRHRRRSLSEGAHDTERQGRATRRATPVERRRDGADGAGAVVDPGGEESGERGGCVGRERMDLEDDGVEDAQAGRGEAVEGGRGGRELVREGTEGSADGRDERR